MLLVVTILKHKNEQERIEKLYKEHIFLDFFSQQFWKLKKYKKEKYINQNIVSIEKYVFLMGIF